MQLSSRFLFSSLLFLAQPIAAQQWSADSTEINLGVHLAQGSLDAQLSLPSLPATDGFAPQLGLAWLSSPIDPGEGFGPGWAFRNSSIIATLDQGGMIHASADRLGKTTGDFKYSLEWDGQRLIWQNSTAATRVSNYTVEHSDNKVLIVRHDRPFTIKLYAGTARERDVTLAAGFRVIQPNGVIRVYSGELNVAEGFVTNAEAKNEFSRTFISRWPLVYEMKPGGNTIEYQYQKVGTAAVLQKIIFAYGRSSYVFHWQEREHGPISRAMGYLQEHRHLYTRVVACFDQKPQYTWVFDYQNGPAASFEDSSCADPEPLAMRSEPAEVGFLSRVAGSVVAIFRALVPDSEGVMSADQPRLTRVHRFGSKVGDGHVLQGERQPTLSFAYSEAATGAVHVQTLAQDSGFRGFGPSGNLEFLDADQDGFIDLMQSSPDGSQRIAGRAGSLDLNDRQKFLVQDPSRSFSIGFNEDSFRQGSVQTADVDGDGWLDIIHIKPNGSWIVYQGDRQGSYRANGLGIQLDDSSNLQIAPEIIGYGRGAIMDIDGDRRADIIYPSLGASGQLEWQVYLNKSDANSSTGFVFQKRRFSFPFRAINPDILQRNDLRFVDANHDGLVDLVKFSQTADGNSSLCIFENMGRTAGGDAYLFAGDAAAEEKGCASQVTQSLPDSGNLSSRINSVWLADINGDGLVDVVDLNNDGRTFSYWLGQVGHTPYATRQEMTLAETATLAIDPQNKYNSFPMDIDLDGVDEIVFFEPSTATLKVLRFPAVSSGTEAGLLTHISEEQGLDHWIQYQPAHRFGFKSGASLPYPAFMVRQIVSHDHTLGSATYRAAVMNYQEPLWDAELGSMLGFKGAQVFEPGTRLAAGHAVEEARLEDYLFATDAQNPYRNRALAGRWAEKSVVGIPWSENDETRFVAEASTVNQTLSVEWNNPQQSRLWREKQEWNVRDFPPNAIPEGTAHLRPRYEVLLAAAQVQRCDTQGLDCASPQREQTLYQYDDSLRMLQSISTRFAYQAPQDSETPGVLPSQSLTKKWIYEDGATDEVHSILRVKSYQEYDDAKANHLAYQEDFEYLGKNTFDQPDASTQTLYRRQDQAATADLPESIRTRRLLTYDIFGNRRAIQDEAGQEIASTTYDSVSGSLLLENHDAGNPSMRYCYSTSDCPISNLPGRIVLPAQGMTVSLRMDSLGAWEYREVDALHRPIRSLTSTGLEQSQSYQLNRTSVTETISDQGQRRSIQTMMGDGVQRVHLVAQTGPIAGQLWLRTWNQFSRRGSPLLSAAPSLLNTQDAQDVVLQKQRDLMPASTQFASYDALGRLTSSSLDRDQNGLSIRYYPWGQAETTRNSQNQPVTQTLVTRVDATPTLIIDPTGNKQIFAKNVWGGIDSVRLSAEAQPRRFLSYGGRLPAETLIPGLRRVTYRYDDRLLIKDRIIRDAKDQVASIQHYSYDEQRRLLQVRNAQNQLVSSFTYANDSLATATQTDPAQLLQVRRLFTPDEQGRVKKEQILYQNRNREIVHQAEENYEYNEDSLLTRRTTAAGFAIDYLYAPDQSMRSVHFKGLGQDLDLFQATQYDASGLLQGASYAGGNLSARWDHDPVTRLTHQARLCRGSSADCTRMIDEQRTFADNGEVLARTRRFPDGDEAASFGYSDRRELVNFERNGSSEVFAYDGSGVRKSGPASVYDSLGRLQKSPTIDAIVYSDSDRPLTVKKGTQTWLLGYDAQGKLVYRIDAADVEGTGAIFLDFEDSVQKGAVVQQTLDLPGTMQALIDSAHSKIDYRWLDAQGSPIATVDGSGAVLERISHSAFGHRQTPIAADSFLPLDFARQRLDADTGLIAFRDRWYDPEAGLFISPDSRTLETPALCLMAQWMDCNLYGYRANNPFAN